MIICGFDLETTGLDNKKDRIIELGAVFYDTASKLIVDEFETLVWERGYPVITEEITEITGITQEMLYARSLIPDGAVNTLAVRIENLKPSCFLAHNASFDKGFLNEQTLRMGFSFDVPWVCSMKDIEHPKKFKCRKLSHLALDYGVAVDPATLHRSIGDIRVMLSMIEKANVNFEHLISRSTVPEITVRAIVPPPFGQHSDGGVGKEKAKSLGYQWNGDLKIWTKTIKEDQIGKEEADLGYRVVRIS